MRYVKTSSVFAVEELDNFKKSEIGKLCLKLIKKDEEYTQ
jgi:hypothetical protein